MKKQTYPWTFTSVGGSVRVKLTSGEDIAHLGELDRKMWTVLSCPVRGLEFDEKTLSLIDYNGDGHVRVDEVVETAQWLTSVLKNPDILLGGTDSISLDDFNEENPEGAQLLVSARQILQNLGANRDSISLEDTADNVKIFARTKFNGDGVITPASAGEDEALAALIAKIAECQGGTPDRSGADGVTAQAIEDFYAACADYDAWKKEAVGEVFRYGEDTPAALAAVEAVKDKVADYFMRCKLIAFDENLKEVVDIAADKIAAVRETNLFLDTEDIAMQPVARPVKEGLLPLSEGLNPAWKDRVETVRCLVLEKMYPGKAELTEQEWNAAVDSLSAYTAWKAAEKGAAVKGLGDDCVKAILSEDRKSELLDLVEKDKALEKEALSIEKVDKLLRLTRDFYTFLNNYVVFSDFYAPDKKAIFQAGRLYIDQRSTDLCLKVDGPSAEISSLSGMYILYCSCSSEKLGKSFNIAAVLTDGDVDGLREGKNAVFYDRQGNDYIAKVTAIVDNPISIRQAFWAPYKKVARWINDKIDKSAAEKNEKAMADLTSTAEKAGDVKIDANGGGQNPVEGVKSSFDIAKFAGIFAAIGMALGFIGQFFVALFKGVTSMPFWELVLIIVAVMLVISGPSMFMAWRKLRKRDLGPILNANGWAINASAYVRAKFGRGLTSLASFPKLQAVDKAARRKQRTKRVIWCLVALLAVLVAGLIIAVKFNFIDLPFPPKLG